MNYRKLIKDEIAKLHTAKGVEVNPKLDSDLGEQIVADICRKAVKNCNIADFISRFISEQQKKEEEIFTTALRIMAEPPIKGDITKGKVRWRGIRIVQYNDGFKYTKWLEQRGRQISPKIVFTGTIGNGL